MITHLIDNGIVVNSICATVEEAAAAYPGFICVEADGIGGIGWEWDQDEEMLIPPAPDPQPAVPAAITPRQGRIVLSRYGMLTAMAEYFAGLTGDGADEARIEFEYANEWRRDWPALVAAAASFGLTAEQIDQMFIAAAAL